MARNCEGKHQATAIKVFDDIFEKCPISVLDREALEVVNVIEATEGEMGGRILPSNFLSEPKYFHNVRQIVLGEKYKIEKKKKDKPGRNG